MKRKKDEERKASPKRIHWISAGLLCVLVVALYFDTISSMVEVWNRSETFAHGYLIAPISFYLIWKKRFEIIRLTPKCFPIGLLGAFGAGVVWLLANVSEVLVVQQFCLVLFIAFILMTTLGIEVFRVVLFPVGFLLFAVPFGEFLIPPMMEFTADFTVGMLKLVGIPVFREGTFFSIPSGDWSVVEGCSGLRYLIASITLGVLYAYISYQSVLRRLAFISLAIAFPILANGMRAFLIVMIAHLSDMTLALGVDHYIYGWVFFGIVMLLMFWIGSFWFDRTAVLTPAEVTVGIAPTSNHGNSSGLREVLVVTLLSGALLGVFPSYAKFIASASKIVDVSSSPIVLPEGDGGWVSTTQDSTWLPSYQNFDAFVAKGYSNGVVSVMVYVFAYGNQAQGRELINSQNVLVRQKDPIWRAMPERRVQIDIKSEKVDMLEGAVLSDRQKFITLRTNLLHDKFTVNEYYGKLVESIDAILVRRTRGYGIVLAADGQADDVVVKSVLNDFAVEMVASIKKSLVR